MKKSLTYLILSVLAIFVFSAGAVEAAEPEILWLENPGEAKITRFYPDTCGEQLFCVGVEVGERIYTAHSPDGAGTFYVGYVDPNGNWVIDPIYNYGSTFSNGLACVIESIEEIKEGAIYGYTMERIIDRTGQTNAAFDKLSRQGYHFSTIQEDYVVISCRDVPTLPPFYGLVNASGEMVLPPTFLDVHLPKDGLCLVQTESKGYGYFDTQGKAVILPQYEDAKDFSDGLAAVQKDQLWGFIDSSGVVQIPMLYDEVQPFSESYAAVKKDNRWGFIDTSGKLVIPCVYDTVMPFSEGVAAVCIAEQWGCVDTTCKEILPCMYQAVEPCKENRMLVKQQNRCGYFDASGKKVIDFLYGAGFAFQDGFAVVSSGDFSNTSLDFYNTGNTFGLIDLYGNKILAEDYIRISDVEDGVAMCQRASDNKVGIIHTEKLLHNNTSNQSQAMQKVTVNLPSYAVSINGQVTDNTYSKYPFLIYKNITYIPMTYYDSRLLGLQTAWSAKTGLEISLAENALPEYKRELVAQKNKKQQTATIASGKIRVNGKMIDNQQEPYPLLVFRDVTYFPLTWRFAVNEFDWQYQFDIKNGLHIESKNRN